MTSGLYWFGEPAFCIVSCVRVIFLNGALRRKRQCSWVVPNFSTFVRSSPLSHRPDHTFSSTEHARQSVRVWHGCNHWSSRSIQHPPIMPIADCHATGWCLAGIMRAFLRCAQQPMPRRLQKSSCSIMVATTCVNKGWTGESFVILPCNDSEF